MAISSLDRVKTLLGISDSTTTYDDLITQLLAGVEAAVEGWCKREFTSATKTEFYTGGGTPRLLLRRRPVSSVSAVYLDLQGNYGQTSGAFAAATLLTAGVDYALEYEATTTAPAGVLRRLSGYPSTWQTWPETIFYGGGTLTEGRGGPVWPAVPGCLKITYLAGYSAMPGDLMLAVDQLAAKLYHEGKFGGSVGPISAERLEDYSYERATLAIESSPAIGSVKQILARYRDIVL